MAKICVCDICLKEGKLTKTESGTRLGRIMRIDVCNAHKKLIPKGNAEFVKFGYSLQGVTITLKEAKDMLSRRY